MEFIIFVALFVICIILFSRVGRLEQRIEKLEKRTVTPSVPTPVAVPAPAVSTVYEAPVVASVPLIPPAPVTPQPEEHGTEFAIGSRWFLGAGAIAVLIGIGFFFRYAFENDLISEPLRVAIGIVLGLIFMGTGAFLKSTYRPFGLSLVGVGLGVVYISCHAAYMLYALVPALVGYGLLVATVLVGVTLSLRYDAKQLAALSLAGGYVSVFLYIEQLALTGAFASLFLLSLLIVFVSYFKKWPEIITLGTLFTLLALLGWSGAASAPVSLVLPLISVLFGVYALSTLFNYARTADAYVPWQSFNLYAVPLGYFSYAQSLIDDRTGKGLLALAVAILYALVALGVRTLAREHIALRRFAEGSLFLVPAFVALAIALYFEGNIQTLLLAVHGALVVIAAVRFGSLPQYLLGQFLLAVSLIFSLGYVMSSGNEGVPVFNEEFLTLAVVTLAYASSWLAHVFTTSSLSKDTISFFRKVDAVLMYLMAFIAVGSEVSRLPLSSGELTAVYVTSGALISLMMCLLGHQANEAVLRYMAYAATAIGTFFLAVVAVVGERDTFFLNVYVGAMLALVVLAAVAYAALRQRKNEEVFAHEYTSVRRWLLVCANLAALVVLTTEIHTYFEEIINADAAYLSRITISLFWLAYAVGGLVIGIMGRSTFSRQVAIVLFLLTTLKVFLYDSLILPDLYRFVSFIALGIILLVVGYLYYRFKDRIRSFVGLTA